MARRLLPWAILVPLLLNWLIFISSNKFNLADEAFSHILGALAMLVTMTLLVWENARSLNQLSSHLQQSNLRLNNVLESTTDGFIAYDHEWRYTYVNARAEALLQRSRDQLLGRVIWECYPDIVDSICDREFHRAMAEQVPVMFEMAYAP